MTLSIKLNGTDYVDFVSAAVSKNMETLTSAFSFVATASNDDFLPIREGDSIEVSADSSFKLLTGYVDSYAVRYNSTDHTIAVKGRSKLSDLVDSTVGAIKEFDRISLQDLCGNVIDELGVDARVKNLAGDIAVLEDIASAEVGQTAFAFLESFARKRQVLLNEDSSGDLNIIRASTDLSDNALKNIFGEPDNNILSASREIDISKLFNAYIAQGQLNPIDLTDETTVAELSGQFGTATDDEIRETRRYEFYSEETTDSFSLTDRAKWELGIRRARFGLVYKAVVQGHTYNDAVWEVNKLYQIDDEMCNIYDQLLCNKILYNFNLETGSTTELSFTNKNAYTLQADLDKIILEATT